MPRNKEFLLEQIARAKRFALAMNTEADRQRFEKMAADFKTNWKAPKGRRVNRLTHRKTRFRLMMPFRTSRRPGARMQRRRLRRTIRSRPLTSPPGRSSHEDENDAQSYKGVQTGHGDAETDVRHDAVGRELDPHFSKAIVPPQ